MCDYSYSCGSAEVGVADGAMASKQIRIRKSLILDGIGTRNQENLGSVLCKLQIKIRESSILDVFGVRKQEKVRVKDR